MIRSTSAGETPPDPAPIKGKAIEHTPSCSAVCMALRTEFRIEAGVARQSMLIPATWMIALKGSHPALVATAPPKGIGPCRATSRNGCRPARLLMAPDTPCGSSSHQGMMFRFQALTMASVGWSSRSPSTIWTSIRVLTGSRRWIETVKDEFGGAGHLDVFAFPPPDDQLAAPAGDGYRLARFGIAMYDSRDRCCAGACAAAPGLSGAALPDSHVHAERAFHPAPHQARALGEEWVMLDFRAEGEEQVVVRQRVHKGNGMRGTGGKSGDGQKDTRLDFQGIIDYPVEEDIHGDVRRIERRPAHIDGHGAYRAGRIPMDLRGAHVHQRLNA